MKFCISKVTAAAVAMLLLAGTAAFAGQDPNDSGVQDSIIIDLACAMEYGEDSLKVTVVVANDNELSAVFIPIFYESPGDYWKADTAWFISDRWKLIPLRGLSDRFGEDPDTAKYVIFAQAMISSIPAGRDSIATITFTKNPQGGANPGPLTIGCTTVDPNAIPMQFISGGFHPMGYLPALDVHYPCNCSMIGDCDNNGSINPVDVVVLCQYSMMIGDAPPSDPYCPVVNRGDFDCDDQVTFSDVVQMVNFVYRSNAVPPCNPCSWEGDSIPPAAVTDLAIADIGPGAITLGWSAPGDDQNTGTATQYDIRYSTALITEDNWDAALPVPGKPAPRPAGTYQTVVVPRLLSTDTYYFALRSLDDARLVAPLSNTVSGFPKTDFIVEFPDQYLNSLLRLKFNRTTGGLYASEMLTVQEIISGYAIQYTADISGLEYCSNIHTLFLPGANIQDVSPLAGLTKLKYLNLSDNLIADITPMANLTELEWVYLLGNQIVDVSPLAGLHNLQQVLLNKNRIADLSPLLGNPGLGQGDLLFVGDNPLSSYSLNVCIPALRARGVDVYY